MTRVVVLEGYTPYVAAHALQEALVEARAAGRIPDTLLVLEHPETITLGRKRTAMANVLAAGTIPVVQVERGGDVTYHGPGQLVIYPIVALEGERRDLWDHLRRMELAVIEALADWGLEGKRDERNTGVWLGEPAHKVCSMGIACRKWVTWHGLALNLDVDLMGFARIRPCGFGADTMTRLHDELASPPSFTEAAQAIVPRLVDHLSLAPAGAPLRVTLHDEAAVAGIVEQLATPA